MYGNVEHGEQSPSVTSHAGKSAASGSDSSASVLKEARHISEKVNEGFACCKYSCGVVMQAGGRREGAHSWRQWPKAV